MGHELIAGWQGPWAKRGCDTRGMTATGAKRLVVAVNPAASFGRRREVGDLVSARLRQASHTVVELVEPDFASLVTATQREVASGLDALVVVGGDGMVHLGVNRVAGTGIPLAIVPSGTGNDAARLLGIPHEDPQAAVDHLLAALGHEPRTMDLGRARWVTTGGGEETRWFAGALSAGFDALVNERANHMRRPKGPSRYTIAMLRELLRLRPLRYRIQLDERVVEGDYLLVCASNGVSIGGGMKVTPNARQDDGLFDVLLVDPFSRIGFLRIFPRVFKGTHLDDPRVHVEQARRVRIEAPVVGYADGERLAPLPIEAEIVPSALRVYA